MNSHLLNAMEKVSELSLNVVSLQATTDSLQETTDNLRKELKEKDGKIKMLEKKVEVLSLQKSSKPVEDCTERDGLKRSDAYHRGMGTVSSSTKRSVGYGRMDSYDSDHGKPTSHMLRERTDKHDNQISRLRENVQCLQQNMTQYSIAVDELRLRQDVQDVKTTHGTFIWKIPDIRRRYRDALDRKTISLYSPPFQTSPHGYRMCVRVYLNGDGAGKGAYVSMFFVLMRSEHDDLLPFPFKQSVRFTLLNQANQAESITEAFAPDLKSQSFLKPEGDMNVASGFPKFARQTVLQDERFTRGNVIYIKAQVDLAGLAPD
ncbi:MAG: hypothetical protein A6F71_04935 [Cycloclasticus sp. symbiont of Poecilosclerida sp. M]|nr:MAG: hypothetical protein A6F71_04935 [Cycloclasticus sp. symbiont of Poecilosclerida sp. M]